MDEEAEDVQAVIHGDDNDTFMGEVFAVLPSFGSATSGEAASVNPDHHGQFRILLLCRCPDVEGEAIFTLAGIVEDHVAVKRWLHTVLPKLVVCRVPCHFAAGCGGFQR